MALVVRFVNVLVRLVAVLKETTKIDKNTDKRNSFKHDCESGEFTCCCGGENT